MHPTIRRSAALFALASVLSATPALADGAKPASPATVAAQRATATTLPADDGQDAEFARRGFLATRSDPLIRAADGRPVWNLDAYKFVTGQPPATVNPSLRRHAALLTQSGLSG